MILRAISVSQLTNSLHCIESVFGFQRMTISPADCPNMKYLLIFATLVCIEFYNCDAGIDIGNQVRKLLSFKKTHK